MEKIKFSENWNNKLTNKIFSTIRKFSDSKFDLYKKNFLKEFNINLKDDDGNFQYYGKAILKYIKIVQLRKMTSNELMLDTGISSLDAIFEFFENLNIKKSDDIILLIFERMERKNEKSDRNKN